MGDWWQKDRWEWLMIALKVVLPLVAALLVLLELRLQRLGRAPSLRGRKLVAVALSVTAFGAYFAFFNPNVRHASGVHREELFHHYLGAKYFEQVGYDRLYECVAAAETELGRRRWVMARELRLQRDQRIHENREPEVQQRIEDCRTTFAENPERWATFKGDVDWLYRQSAGSSWDNGQKSHGFNAPPVWVLEGKLLASLGELGGADPWRFVWLACSVDVLLNGAMLLLLFWAFGWRVGAVATIWWSCNGASDFFWTGGAFLRQDWLFCLVLALCLAKKRHFAGAGAALATSALLRGFPLFFFFGWLVIVAARTLGRLRAGLPISSAFLADHRRLLVGATVATALLVPASMLATTGPRAYVEFVRHLAVWATTPLTDRMGLDTLLAQRWDDRMRFLRDDLLTDPFQRWKEHRIARQHELAFVRLALQFAVVGWTAWILRHERRLWVGLALSAALVAFFVDLPNYYFSFFTVAAALTAVQREIGAVFLLSSCASQILNVQFFWIDDKFAAQAALFVALSLMLLFAMTPRRFPAPIGPFRRSRN